MSFRFAKGQSYPSRPILVLTSSPAGAFRLEDGTQCSVRGIAMKAEGGKVHEIEFRTTVVNQWLRRSVRRLVVHAPPPFLTARDRCLCQDMARAVAKLTLFDRLPGGAVSHQSYGCLQVPLASLVVRQ